MFGYLAKSSFRKRREEAGFEWVQDKMSDEHVKQGLWRSRKMGTVAAGVWANRGSGRVLVRRKPLLLPAVGREEGGSVIS